MTCLMMPPSFFSPTSTFSAFATSSSIFFSSSAFFSASAFSSSALIRFFSASSSFIFFSFALTLVSQLAFTAATFLATNLSTSFCETAPLNRSGALPSPRHRKSATASSSRPMGNLSVSTWFLEASMAATAKPGTSSSAAATLSSTACALSRFCDHGLYTMSSTSSLAPAPASPTTLCSVFHTTVCTLPGLLSSDGGGSDLKDGDSLPSRNEARKARIASAPTLPSNPYLGLL
mmetsp:Transcript_50417/g.105274  ORF Transcript_50417/g.105274 Transcript_50417/m.105274 type:complete len:233 (+) Transcript_50417:396-1094(+)